MRIDTSRFGPLDLDEKTMIHFPWGIPGFESLRRFFLLQHRDGPFHWLQAADDPIVALPVCAPETIGLNYRVPVDKAATIEVQKEEDLMVMIIVAVDRETGGVRPNLQGPLLFNVASRIGCQWTVDASDLEKYILAVPDADKEAEAPAEPSQDGKEMSER